MTTFTVDPDRLERYRAEADAARGASRSASGRLTEARLQLREANDELQRWERSLPGALRFANVRDANGNMHRRGESQHERGLTSARTRVEVAQAEVARLADAQSQGAGAREHVRHLFARLEAYAQERTQ